MKKLILIALIIGTAFSCQDFEGWNVDTKNPSEVPASFLMTSAQRTIFLRMTSPSVNYNIFKMFSQHWTATTYTDEANYDLRQRDVSGGFWIYMYRDVLMDLQEAKILVEATATNDLFPEAVKKNQLAVIELLEVYTWHVIVDTFGDAPYTEALLGSENLLPAYDDDETIYMDLFSRLDAALAKISGNDSFDDADLMYSGNMTNWAKFGNSLKLRMALRISDANPTSAKMYAEQAVNAGVFTSIADNATFPFEDGPPNANPIWSAVVESGRSDIVLANTFTDLINPLNDPRAEYFMDDNIVPYTGGPYGANNPFANFTHLGDIFHEPDFEGTILSYEEVAFLLAEAVERNFITGDAEMYYNDGITASIEYWTGSTTDAADYLAQSTVAYDAANWKKSVGEQKWIALFGKGFEAWSSWRMLDYPAMNVADESGLPVPRRYLYGNDDAQINGANYDNAASAMGGDELDSRVFWDIMGVGN